MRIPTPVLALVPVAVLGAAMPVAAQEVSLESNFSKYSYGVGMQIGRNLRGQGQFKIDAEALAAGVEDVLAERAPRVSQSEMQAAVVAYQKEAMAERLQVAQENKAEGDEFLATNGERQGVEVLPSGVQYEIVSAGEGPSPAAEDTVLVHYRGRLLDGTEFDSSYERGEPTELQIPEVIEGWQETLQLMHVGSKWKVWIPADKAYGLRGAGGVIGPNEALSFDIELLEIKSEGG